MATTHHHPPPIMHPVADALDGLLSFDDDLTRRIELGGWGVFDRAEFARTLRRIAELADPGYTTRYVASATSNGRVLFVEANDPTRMIPVRRAELDVVTGSIAHRGDWPD